jgi:formate/nitrite transporter FocA (FNT family)
MVGVAPTTTEFIMENELIIIIGNVVGFGLIMAGIIRSKY